MNAKLGRKAPDFELSDYEGNVFKLSGIDTGYALIFFYPKDDTPGCTLEAQGFNALQAEFRKLDVTPVGISGGNAKTKRKFCEKHHLELPLLSDEDFAVARAFGAFGKKQFMGRTYEGILRQSFLLRKDGEILQHFEKVAPAEHPQEVLELIKSQIGGVSPRQSARRKVSSGDDRAAQRKKADGKRETTQSGGARKSVKRSSVRKR